ncbi:MAG: HNH endonuclease [Bdellovibrio sp.]|nr:HNH endonuclease [Bdellovibrio sp.]
MALLSITLLAVVTALMPNLSFYAVVLWVGSAMTFAFILLFFPKQRFSKNRYKDAQGYIIVKGSNEYEHRHIAKLTLHRKLFPNEVVHHINGIRSDNRLINLCVLDRHQHELIHAWLDWKKKRTGRYPSFKEQKKMLVEKHNGILLENHSSRNFKRYNSPLRHKFVINKPKFNLQDAETKKRNSI